MRDIRISLNHDDLCYEAEEIRGGHLDTLASGERFHDVLMMAKDECKNPGDRIMAHDGTIYTKTQKGWRTDKPSN